MTANPYQPPPWGQPGAPRTGVPAPAPPGYQGGYGQQPSPGTQQGPPPGSQPPPGTQQRPPPAQQPPPLPRPRIQRPTFPELTVQRSSPGGPPPRKKRSPVPWIFGSMLGIISVTAVLLLGFVAPGWFVRPVFDGGAVQKGVQQILRGSYKLGAVESVRCPSEVPVEPLRTFECQVKLGPEQQRTVTVTVKDRQGVYAVGYPR